MELLAFINSIIATIGMKNILILLGAVVGVVWSTIMAIVYLIRRSNVEKIGPVTFDTDDEKPKPRKRRVLRKKV